MKQVIDRKLYDTETAERIAQYTKIGNRNDFHEVEESLYKTENGNYFLYRWGGAATEYAERCPGGQTASENIKPLEAAEAIKWCERRAIDGDIVAKEFGDKIESA